MNFWSMLDEPTRQAFQEAAGQQRYSAGEVVIHEGDRSGWVLVLREGRVKVVTSTEKGYDAVLGVREPGDIIGEMAAVDGSPRSASVIAMQDVVALRLPAARFAELMRRPAVYAALLKIISFRLRRANIRRADFGDRTTAVRLAALLIELVDMYGVRRPDGTIMITLRMSQQDIAGLISASRESVSRALRELRDKGVISTGRRRIIVHNLEELRRQLNA